MISISSGFRPFSLAGLVFCLGACQLPSPIPSGYTYHSDLYKSPPAAAPEDIGIPWSAESNEQAAVHWRVAARDMAGQIAQGLPGRAVHIIPSEPDDPVSSVFENYLREALMARGIRLENLSGSEWPDLTWDLAIVADNPQAARWVLAKRPVLSEAGTHPVSAKQSPAPDLGAPVSLVERETMDLPPQTVAAPVPAVKPSPVPTLPSDTRDMIALRVDLLQKGIPMQSWGGAYTVSGIESYRDPSPELSVLRSVVGRKPREAKP